jgi:Domain of unknown function (DUF5615)
LRLFLDLHVSGRAVGQPLQADGHDVVAGDADRRWLRMPDAELLRAAAAADRVVVTFDTGLVRLANEWAAERLDHAGVMLLVGIETHEFGVILRAVRHLLVQVPRQEAWRNLLMKTGRSSA